MRNDFKYIILKENKYSKYKRKCKCGHSVLVSPINKKKICKNCGHYVYADKNEEFKEKLLKELKK